MALGQIRHTCLSLVIGLEPLERPRGNWRTLAPQATMQPQIMIEGAVDRQGFHLGLMLSMPLVLYDSNHSQLQTDRQRGKSHHKNTTTNNDKSRSKHRRQCACANIRKDLLHNLSDKLVKILKMKNEQKCVDQDCSKHIPCGPGTPSPRPHPFPCRGNSPV